MRQVIPYKTARGLERALDNGGRWFNLFTSAGDGKVSANELAKAAGSWDRVTSEIFLTMSWVLLTEAERVHILDVLMSPEFTKRIRKYGPLWLRAHRAVEVPPGRGVVLEGTMVRVADHRSDSVVMMPFMINNVMTLMPVPIANVFSVWELHDGHGEPATVLVGLRDRFAENLPMRLGGVSAQTEGERPLRYLRPAFYTALDGRERGRVVARPEDEWIRDALGHVVR